MLSPALIWPHFDPEAAAGERAIPRRLRRARPSPITAGSPLALAALALGIDAPPAAALTRLAEGRTTDSVAFLAEPVMLSPDRDRLLLQRLGEEPLNPSESQALIESAHGHFPENELRLERTGTGHWYARFGGVEARAGIAIEAAEGASITATPEAFGVSLQGMRVLNELQMLWFEHPVNVARKQAGRPQANALWVWGGGTLPSAPSGVEAHTLVADAPELAGLAQWLGVERRDPDVARIPVIEPGLVVALGPGADTTGRSWLDAFCRQRHAFRLFAAGRMWHVPGRHLWQRW